LYHIVIHLKNATILPQKHDINNFSCSELGAYAFIVSKIITTMNNFDKKVMAPLIRNLSVYGDRNSFFIQNAFYIYDDLARRFSAIRDRVKKIQESYVALVANDDLDTYAAILALWAEGKCYVPLHPNQPMERLMNIIEQVGLNTVLDSSATSRFASETVIHIGRLPFSSYRLEAGVGTSDDADAYLLFTSGSTGVPKGVPISRGNVAAFTDAFREQGYSLGPDDRCLQMFDLTFDLSVQSYLMPLLSGACVYTVAPAKLKYNAVFQLLDEQALTFALMVPSVIHYLRPYMDEIRVPTMRYSLFCGEALLTSDVEAWSQCVPNARIDNVYGPTENTIYCTSYTYQPGKQDKECNGIVCIGKGMAGTRTAVVDENLLPVEDGKMGELCLSGSQLTRGYWKNEAKNAEAFFSHLGTRYYRTGDLCIVDKDGDISYCGRMDSQVKIQGYRIELGEIEHYARTFAKTGNAVCILTNSSSGQAEIALCIEGKEGDGNALLTQLQNKLPAYMIPSIIRYIPNFPLNANGKTDRKVLKRLIERPF
jgi:D-alanine--poly(phosphoribitol) ligase subunit 1